MYIPTKTLGRGGRNGANQSRMGTVDSFCQGLGGGRKNEGTHPFSGRTLGVSSHFGVCCRKKSRDTDWTLKRGRALTTSGNRRYTGRASRRMQWGRRSKSHWRRKEKTKYNIENLKGTNQNENRVEPGEMHWQQTRRPPHD